MRVVDVRDFCIPSDGSDYDELVAFADAMAGVPQFDAVPIAVLDKIKADIKEWYWQADKQAPAKDPCVVDAVVDAMVDLFIRTVDKYKAESEGGKE